MSGGSFNYVQHLDGHESLVNHGVVENVAALANQLASYGEPGQLAAARTQAYLLKLEAHRALLAQMEQELNAQASELSHIWHQVDLHSSCDAGVNDVMRVLYAHDEQADLVAISVELAVADAIDDQTTTFAETGKRWQFLPELSPDPIRRAARLALQQKMSERQRDDTVIAFHQALEPIKYFVSGQPVDTNFLLSIL